MSTSFAKRRHSPLLVILVAIEENLDLLPLLFRLRRTGENERTRFQYADRVLFVGAQAAVFRNDRPVVAQLLDALTADVDHRLDRDDKTRLDLEILIAEEIRIDEVRNLRRFVHCPSDPVTDKLLDDRKTVGMNKTRHFARDVAPILRSPEEFDRQSQRVARNLNDFLRFVGNVPDETRIRGIAAPSRR